MSREFWLVFGFAFYMISTLISMGVMSIGALVLFLILLAYGRGLGRPQGAAPKVYFLASVALVLSCALSLFWAQLAPMGFDGNFIHVNPWPSFAKFWYLFWPLILLPALSSLSEEARYKILRAWLLAFFALSVIGVIQHFTGWPRPQEIPGMLVNGQPRFHATVFLGHHLSVASIFIFPFFATLDFLADSGKARRLGLSRTFLAGIVGVGLLALFLTYSRTLWLALPLGIFFWLVWTLPRRWGWALAAGLAVGGIVLSQSSAIQHRFHDGLGFSTRQELWKANWEFFKLRPLLGAGWRQNQELSGIFLHSIHPGARVFQGHAHNNFLDMLGGTGFLGTLSWLFWCAVVFWILWPLARRSIGFSRGLFCAWLVFQLNGLTQLNFWEGKVTHQMVSMVAWSLLWSRKSE